MATPRVFKNTSKQKITIPSADLVFEPGQAISITADFHPPINHPEIVEITDEPAPAKTKKG